MGIKIVSVLAKHSTKLSSGVRLKPCLDKDGHEVSLPDPQQQPEEYVKEVIKRWYGGHSHRPPTWTELLVVLQDIGHKNLSQQIENFMRSKL